MHYDGGGKTADAGKGLTASRRKPILTEKSVSQLPKREDKRKETFDYLPFSALRHICRMLEKYGNHFTRNSLDEKRKSVYNKIVVDFRKNRIYFFSHFDVTKDIFLEYKRNTGIYINNCFVDILFNDFGIFLCL